MHTICIPITVLAELAYYHAIEQGKLAFELEAPQDHFFSETFWEEVSKQKIADGVQHGEWTGDRIELEGAFEYDDSPVKAVFEMDWNPDDGGETHVFVQFEWI